MSVFRRVVERMSFAAAARDLRLSTAAVSKHVAALEAALQTKLLHRTTRQVSATTAGAEYYEHCKRILDDVAETEQSLGRGAATPSGLLRVNVPLSFGLSHLTKILPELLVAYPELSLDISYSDRFVDLIEERVDVAVRIARSLPDSSSLVAVRLARGSHVLCASPAYVARHGAPRSPSEVAQHACLIYGLSTTPAQWLFKGPRGTTPIDVQGRLTSSNSLAIRDAVLSGAGISLLPSFYVQAELADGRLVALLERYETPSITVSAVYPKSKHLSPKVRVLIEHLKRRFADAGLA